MSSSLILMGHITSEERPRWPRRTSPSPRGSAAPHATASTVGRRPVDTVFVGGGTPSLLGAARLGEVLGAVRDAFGLAPGAEVTTESNPESTSPEFFAGQTDWITVPTIRPDSGDVKHHPFDGETNHFVDCVLNNKESFVTCNYN